MGCRDSIYVVLVVSEYSVHLLSNVIVYYSGGVHALSLL